MTVDNKVQEKYDKNEPENLWPDGVREKMRGLDTVAGAELLRQTQKHHIGFMSMPDTGREIYISHPEQESYNSQNYNGEK